MSGSTDNIDGCTPSFPVPADRDQRERQLWLARTYVKENGLIGPLSLEQLQQHAQAVLTMGGIGQGYLKFQAVLINNEVCRDQVAAVPMDRRLFLLPQCLRKNKQCKANVSELGLECGRCGSCAIDPLLDQAQRSGYVVLVAEGSPLVMSLVASGKVEAIIGVSCLDVLERVFPYMLAAGVPGLAIPLIDAGCSETSVDMDWVWDAINLSSDDRGRRMNLQALGQEVAAWFEHSSLQTILGPPDGHAWQIALEWIGRSGKRWRPFISAGVYQALSGLDQTPPEDFKKIALAVECFHKASLIHDDIEDKDELRYGQKTLHEQYGVPIALNVGDLLLGMGYRLIAACEAPPEAKARMFAVASRGHCELCAGQGAELDWTASPGPLSVASVVGIFRQKTAPAFEVALTLGAIYAGGGTDIASTLGRYSKALGIAYQIQDDLDDLAGACNDIANMRLSILPALAYERADASTRELLAAAWFQPSDGNRAKLLDALDQLDVPAEARKLLESYRKQAIDCLGELKSQPLQTLLRRMAARIFVGDEVMGCCNEYMAEHASRRREGSEVS